ncbi:hypothetical protein CRG98_027541 [Punica granatum]|uniref:WRKY domain-containing protein n=3 Tax=Punica granatum TaxID=22663 RepID=A0A2I0J7A7_PUNGR|nr:hypothetical protein CRG98_027541 [Punica granatum]
MGDWERKNLINELIQGMELAKHLQLHLNSPSSSNETREALAVGILASYQKALSMLSWRSPMMGEPSSAVGAGVGTFRKSESPPSLSGGSPHSGDSDREVRDQEHGDASKKRKAVARWTKQVRVGPGVELECPLDDGYSWRKYGQKDILGAKFPRGYYRCTHRNIQGCLATKQVQRSDEDPMVFEITYRGRHTCNEPARGINPQTSTPEQNHQHQQQHLSPEILQNLRGLRVITEDLDSQNQPLFPHFNFTHTQSFLPPFVSSGGNDVLQGNAEQSSFHISGSDHLSEIVSAATSRTNSTTPGSIDYSISEFNQNTPFGSPDFFK